MSVRLFPLSPLLLPTFLLKSLILTVWTSCYARALSHCIPVSSGQSSAEDLSFVLPLEQPFTTLFIKNHISGGRTVEAEMELEAGGTLEESESRGIGLHVLGVAAWMQGGLYQGFV